MGLGSQALDQGQQHSLPSTINFPELLFLPRDGYHLVASPPHCPLFAVQGMTHAYFGLVLSPAGKRQRLKTSLGAGT